MKAPSFLAPFLDGDSPKRLIQGLAVGAIGTMVIGFNWGGWNIGSTVEQKVETAGVSAMVAALAPICADKFEQAAKADCRQALNTTRSVSNARDGIRGGVEYGHSS